MADFAAIRFQPSRPLLRELSADRLNSILAEIKRNKPLPGRGISVRQTGQGTAIDLAAAIPRGTPSTPQPWDLIARQDPDNEGQYLVTVRPGTLNGFLPTNWDEEFVCSDTGLHYAKAVIATDGQAITGVTIEIDITAPTAQEPQEFGIANPVEIVFGLFSEGTVYRTIGAGNISGSPKLWLTTERQTPPQAGELPFSQYFFFR